MEKTKAATKHPLLWGISVSAAGILVVSAVFSISAIIFHKTTVILGNTTITVTVADTPEARELGLGARKNLGVNQGMLFTFADTDLHGFWMKDMLFPIDIIWFDAGRRIVFVKENAKPASYPEVFTPKLPTPYILEVPAGFFAYHQLKVGDVLEIHR